MRLLTIKAFAGQLVILLCSLESAVASGNLEGPGPGTELGAQKAVFGSSVPFTTEDFLNAMRQAIRTETIKSERLNDIYWDKKPRRLWVRSDNGSNLAWSQAIEHCEELELGDFSDWRLPSIEELEDLHDPTSGQTFKVPKEINLSACCQWSATKHTKTSAWNFSFRFRKPFSGSLTYSLDLRALCIRGPIDELPIDWPQESK